MMAALAVNAQEVNDSTYNNQNPPPGFNQLTLITEFGGGVGYYDPTIPNLPHPAPVMAPHVYYNEDDVALFFDQSCIGCTLSLIPSDEEEDEYITVIASQLVYLPLWLCGEYELQIVRGHFCFYTFLEIY